MKYASLGVALLIGCSAFNESNEANIERARAAIMNFQAMCMAAEQDESYDYDCTKAKYDLCKEAFRQHHEVWFSRGGAGYLKDRDGNPVHKIDMEIEMAENGCRPELE